MGVRYKHVCTRVDSEGHKNCELPFPARGSNPGSSDLNSDSLTTELRPPSRYRLLGRVDWYVVNRQKLSLYIDSIAVAQLLHTQAVSNVPYTTHRLVKCRPFESASPAQ